MVTAHPPTPGRRSPSRRLLVALLVCAAIPCLGLSLLIPFVRHSIFREPAVEQSAAGRQAKILGAVEPQLDESQLVAGMAADAAGDELRDSTASSGANSLLARIARKRTYFPVLADDLAPKCLQLPADRIHAVTMQTDDGLVLNGWHLLAEGHTAAGRMECDRELSAGRPLALYFPGNSGHRGDRIAEVALLTRVGADVFLFDYRGYGDNPGTPGEAAFAADARTVWNYATSDRRVPHDRILLYGESIGGAVATRLASEISIANSPPAGLFIRSTSSNLADAARLRYPLLPERMLPTERYAAVEHIANVTSPILMLHGALDETIPYALGRKVFDAAPATSADGTPKRFVDLPHSGHNDVVETDGELLQSALREFVERLFPDR
jgi:fermentation-respiration switch protein FrsA (DUF1100 family)